MSSFQPSPNMNHSHPPTNAELRSVTPPWSLSYVSVIDLHDENRKANERESEPLIEMLTLSGQHEISSNPSFPVCETEMVISVLNILKGWWDDQISWYVWCPKLRDCSTIRSRGWASASPWLNKLVLSELTHQEAHQAYIFKCLTKYQ